MARKQPSKPETTFREIGLLSHIINSPPILVEGRFGRFQSTTIPQPGKLTVVRRLELKPLVLKPTDVRDLAQFLKAVDDDQATAFSLRRRRGDFSEWLKSVNPSQANTYGNRALREFDYDTARRLFEIVLNVNPNDEHALVGLSRALIYLGNLREARSNYETILQSNPESLNVFANLASLDMREGRWESALKNYEIQLKLRSTDVFSIANISEPLARLGRWVESEQASARAASLQPANDVHKLRVTLARICQGKVAGAEAEMEVAAIDTIHALSVTPSMNI